MTAEFEQARRANEAGWNTPFVRGSRQVDETVPLFADIITATKDPEAPPVQTHRINYHSYRARMWMLKHLWHCMHNGLTFHMAPCEVDSPARSI